MGTVPEAWVGIRFGMCSQFLVFDTQTMEYVVLIVPPHQEEKDREQEQVSLAAIRAVARHDVSVVITGAIKPLCRQTLQNLGIEVIDGVEGMTVQEAVEHYKATGLQTPESRKGILTRVAVTSHGEGLDALLEVRFGVCSSFIVVEPTTMEWEIVRVEPDGPAQTVNREAIRAIARSGAAALITTEIHPECCMVLRALAIDVYVAPKDITVRKAIEMYEAGELELSLASPEDA
jgi:predicted Fe-Mo cluster-binding NifX family protein